MNQQTRYTEMKCYKCKENKILVRKEYNKHISDYVLVEVPICEECKRGGKL